METNFFGSIHNIQKTWEVYDWICVSLRIAILCSYIISQSVISCCQRFLKFSVQNHLMNILLKINQTLCNCVPFFGKHLQQVLPKAISFISERVLPGLEKLSQVVQLCFQLHVVEMTLKDKKNVQIFVTAESDDLNLYDENNRVMTTLLISNHRSINDYVLINYLLQHSGYNSISFANKREILKNFWSTGELSFPRLKFLTWGKVVNFPHLSLIKNILIKDENSFVMPKEIKQHLSKDGNEVVTIFPEVNILTTELSIVQRKLNQDYSFVAKFYNVLYPRFKSFISVVRCFGNINRVKTKHHSSVFDNAKKILNNGVDKFVIKASSQSENTVEQDFAQASMVLGLQNSYGGEIKEEPSKCNNGKQEKAVPKELIRVNRNLFDFTIVYYKPKCTNTKFDHDHLNGQFKLHNGYQLEQVNPSFFEMLQPEKVSIEENPTYTTTKPPIVIMIHIKKHELGPLLPAKGRNLEKWLENQWSQKDKLIDCIENGISIR